MGYYKENEEKTAERMEKEQSSGDDFQFLKWVADRDYDLRILPPWSEEGIVWRKIMSHHQFPWKGKIRAFLCLDYVFQNKSIAKWMGENDRLSKDDYDLYNQFGCPACVYWKKLADMKSKETGKQKPKPRFMFNVYDVNRNVVEIAGVGTLLFKAISKQRSLDPDLFHPTKGKVVRVSPEGEKLDRKYPVAFSPKETPIPDGLELFDLDEVMAMSVFDFMRTGAGVLLKFPDKDPREVLGDIVDTDFFSTMKYLAKENANADR